jgi:hypothetical protein
MAGKVETRIEDSGPERVRSFVQLRIFQRCRLRETGILGVSLDTERGTTQTEVKVLKC